MNRFKTFFRICLPAIRIVITILFCTTEAFAQLRLPAIIGSNMVLQRNKPVPIWGWAAPGQQISVQFGDQSLIAVAGPDSLWQVKLTPLKANSSPKSMTIAVGGERKILENILVGEVWICSGQSNMEYPVDKRGFPAAEPARGIDSAILELQLAHPGIRVIKIETKLNVHDAVTLGWQEAEGKIFAQTSAVAFFFAKQLHTKLGVPVGVITSAWSGSRIEPWTPPDAYARIPAFADDRKKSDTTMDGSLEGNMYHSMIAPLIPFAINGFIWYQGESNCLIKDHDMRYAYKMQAMIEWWRQQWGGQLPFYYILIAPFQYTGWKDNVPRTTETLPNFWEQQIAAGQIPNTGFISVSDLVDNLTDIHPPYKWIVGRRLANLALSKTYKQKDIAYLQPQFDYKKIKDSTLVIYFKNARGLKTIDGKAPDFFTIAGADGKFLPATAIIKGKTIILSNSAIKKPVDARLGWTEGAIPNLANEAGLPAIPFRTNAEIWVYETER
jgi:sialate O-acetylesterase